ncbi:MAG: hypothetical protein M9957_02830 [Rhodobacteraceae bacterium]|nr:hypothetical protein [Paracoccaceae bacterium]
MIFAAGLGRTRSPRPEGHDARLADDGGRAGGGGEPVGTRGRPFGTERGRGRGCGAAPVGTPASGRQPLDSGHERWSRARARRRAEAQTALDRSREDYAAANAAQEEATGAAEERRNVWSRPTTRAPRRRRAGAGASRAVEADGEAGAACAEVAALAKLVEREAATGKQLLDRVRVDKGV